MADTFIAPESTSTVRFTLRSWMPGDGAALQEAAVASYDHLARWMPWAQENQSVEQSEAVCRRCRSAWLASTDFTLAIFGFDGRVLGGTGYHLREGPIHTRSAEIGMWIRSSEAGTGLGTAVLEELVHWGFTQWPWERLSWKCHGDNEASKRVAEKAGFVFEGVIRGEYDPVTGGRREGHNYSLLRTEWAQGGARGA